MVGKTLSHYEILQPLGAGGMGEVYRALDTKLERDVAIKVLPEDFAADPDRLARFEREAKLLASLNHPNIAAVYGLEDEGETRFIAMELVEGETLAARLERGGRLDVDEAMEVARQIAEALEAAHDSGVIHRDLKPANVIVAADGKAKVLDFGLAKAYEGSAATDPSALSDSPTVAAQTRAGVILGTAAYMSPEQVKAANLDKRTDIWSFGCVLFEMLSGRRVFGAESVSETLAEVLKSEPDWSLLPADTPASVHRLLRRSLEKDPRRRLPDIGVARLEIDEASAAPAGEGSSSAELPVVRSGRGWLPWALAGLFAIAAGVLGWSNLQPGDTSPPRRVDIAIPYPEQVLHSPEEASFPVALSPDGRQFAYVAGRPDGVPQLLVRADGWEAEPIEGSEGAQAPFFSPDGRWIGFFAKDALWTAELPDGQALEIAKMTILFPSASWGNDGTIVFSDFSLGLAKVSATGEAAPESLTSLKSDRGELRHFAPQILPGGRSVLFTVADAYGFSAAVLDLETNRWERVLENAESARYVSTGHLVFARSGALHAVPFKLDRLETTGAVVSTTERVPSVAGLGAQRFAVSNDGTLAYLPEGAGATRTRMVWVDPQGVVTPVDADPALFRDPSVSPNGEQIAVIVGGSELWVYDAGGNPSVVTTEGYNIVPKWDGDRLLFSTTRPGASFDLYSVPADKSSDPVEVLRRDNRQFPVSKGGPDGSVLAFLEVTSQGGDIGMLDMLEMGPPNIIIAGPHNEHSPMFHPEGRWFAYVSDETGEEMIYVTRYPDRSGFQRVSEGREPLWSRDGLKLFFRVGERVMKVDVQEISDTAITFGQREELFSGRYLMFGVGSISYDVAPDGRFLMLQLPEITSSRIKLVLNWFEELNAQVIPGIRPR